ncbi:protein of unknown function [Candidatus Nitrospira inopinata]|uniref:Uncharacterized protein n=1 Tax=Candidatus Nitrospira inopinata TaxID=1715989 RepID=A0A0S4KQR0_9BACT|nr:protein of unknown function [Candidatus Nitrospira inopinata]
MLGGGLDVASEYLDFLAFRHDPSLYEQFEQRGIFHNPSARGARTEFHRPFTSQYRADLQNQRRDEF